MAVINILGKINPKTGKGIPSLAKGHYQFGLYARIVGYRNVERAYYNAIAKMQGATRMGIVRSIQHLREKMLTEAPQEPWGVDKGEHKGGTLSNSWTVEETAFSTTAHPSYVFGYDMDKAPYAWYVHEMTNPPYGDVDWTIGRGTPPRTSPGPQWLQIHFERERVRMIEIIRSYMAIPLK